MTGARRHGTRVAVALGSNLGNRLDHLRFAVVGLSDLMEDLVASGVYDSPPISYEAQPRFLNAVVVGRTTRTPRRLLRALQALETRRGRCRSGPRHGPRSLDLDLLLLGDSVIDTPELVVPHPRLHERAFVLMPLGEIAADWIVPATRGREAATVAELAAAVSPKGVERTNLRLEAG